MRWYHFLFLLVPINLSAQTTVEGSIFNEHDEPLIGAAIRVVNGSKGTISNEEGAFRIENIPGKHFVLEYSHLGYAKYYDTLGASSEVISINPKMSPSSILADEFIVAATRVSKGSAVSHTNLNKEAIQEMNIGRDMPYVLQQTPSVVTTSDAGAGIGYTGMRIRGVDQSNINVTINGISLNDAESHGVFWVDIPDFASSLEDIQIQRGVGTSTNGAGAFGATVNLQTEELRKDGYGEFSTAYGSFNTGKLSAKFGSGLINDRWFMEGRLSALQSDGYIERATSDLRSYYLAGGYNNGKTSVKALLFGGFERTYQAWYGVDSATLATDRRANVAGAMYDAQGNITGYYPNEVDNYDQDHLQLILNQSLGKHFRLNLAGHYTYGRGYFEQFRSNDLLGFYGIDDIPIKDTSIQQSDIIVRQWLDNHYYGFTFNLNYNKGGLNIDVGGAANQYDGDHFGEIVWARFSGSSNTGDEYYRNKGLKNDANTYLKVTGTLGEKITVFADLQGRLVEYTVGGNDEWAGNIAVDDQLFFFNPKAGISHRFRSNQELYYSFAVANREPNRNDYLGALPEVAKPEMLLDNELGYRLNFASNWIQANVYHMYYFDQLVLTGEINNVGEALRANSGRSYRAGLEFSAGLFIFPRLLFRPNITISSNKNLNYKVQQPDGSFEEKETDIAFSPALIENTSLQYRPFDFLYLTWYSVFVSDQHLDNSGSDRLKLDAYAVNDVRVEFRKGFKKVRELSLFVQVNNILDAKYESNGYVYFGTPYYFPQAGINYMTGVGLKF